MIQFPQKRVFPAINHYHYLW